MTKDKRKIEKCCHRKKGERDCERALRTRYDDVDEFVDMSERVGRGLAIQEHFDGCFGQIGAIS